MKIILAGGGNPEQVTEVDKYFVDAINLKKKVLYIPVAMEKEVFTYEECMGWFKATYGPLGIENIEMCTNLKELYLDDSYAAIFVGGGNTYKLLKEIKDSDFESQLNDFLNHDGVYYGGSAGSIICGKTIKSAGYLDENNVGLSNLSAFNFFDGYDIWCHYDETHKPSIEMYANNLYVLYEESGLVKDGDKVFGIGSKEYFAVE